MKTNCLINMIIYINVHVHTCVLRKVSPIPRSVFLNIIDEQSIFFSCPWTFLESIFITARSSSHLGSCYQTWCGAGDQKVSISNQSYFVTYNWKAVQLSCWWKGKDEAYIYSGGMKFEKRFEVKGIWRRPPATCPFIYVRSIWMQY